MGFTSNVDLSADAVASITIPASSFFTNLELSWFNTKDIAVPIVIGDFSGLLAGTISVTPILNFLSSTFSAGAGTLSQFLVVSWDTAVDGAGFDISVTSTIPLPAGLLLILTGIGGLAVVGRRRREVTAA